ncbi:MAG: serine/threonine protein kinase [Betaproteobacteria bacterium]|nr:serine/threonine protein kinase [Betaproteobacteria bacterium]
MSIIEIGQILAKRYRVEREIGKGGMGTVLKATDLKEGQPVAIKYCHLDEADAIRRFSREVRVMGSINNPHVILILHEALKHHPPYFVMPYAQASLGSRLEEFSSDENAAIAAFLELCAGVLAVHKAGAIHRDINPNNALIIDGRIVLSDLGLAKLTDRDTTVLTQTMAIVGTQMYLAPEQRLPAGSRDADERTDIFQLGKTLYQLVTGLEPLLTDLSKVSPGLAHIIRKSTQEHPDQRYQSVGQLIDAIGSYQKAKDPDSNPLGAFDAIVNRIEERLRRCPVFS